MMATTETEGEQSEMEVLVSVREEELEKTKALPIDTTMYDFLSQKFNWFLMTIRTQGVKAGLKLVRKNIVLLTRYITGARGRSKAKQSQEGAEEQDEELREIEAFRARIDSEDKGPIRVLDLCYYMICPPTSGGMLRILAPIMKMHPEQGIAFSMVFTTYSEEYAEECEAYLNGIPVMEFSKGVVAYKYKSPLGTIPEGIPKDVWETVSRELVDYLRKLLAHVDYDIIQVEHSQLAWIVPFLREFSPKSKIVLDAHNIEYRIYETWLPYCKPDTEQEIRDKYILLRDWERKVWPWFDYAFSVSSEEQHILQESGIPGTYLVPTGGGIDPGKYTPKGDLERSLDILYIGSMNWYANAHGLIWFIENVMPIIEKRRPGTEFNIVGSGMPMGDLLTVTSRCSNIKFWGFQEDDVGFFHRSKVFVVPLWIGAGARVKVITAWAAKIPVVSTVFGAEGSKTENGKNIILTDEPEVFAEAILRILDDPEYRNAIAESAYATFLENYTVERCAELLDIAYKEMAGESDGGSNRE